VATCVHFKVNVSRIRYISAKFKLMNQLLISTNGFLTGLDNGVYNTQNDWVFGLCPSSGFLEAMSTDKVQNPVILTVELTKIMYSVEYISLGFLYYCSIDWAQMSRFYL
jgi:hypothetical protein